MRRGEEWHKLLDNWTSGTTYSIIARNPGIQYTELSKRTGLNNGALQFILKNLEENEYIKFQKERGRKMIYPFNHKLPKDNGEFRPNSTHKEILETIGKKPGITSKELQLAMEMSPPGIHYNLDTLMEEGLIKRTNGNGSYRYYLSR